MPRIQQYFAKGKITPSDIGVSAWETAGRRIGPLYSEIASNAEKLASLQAEEYHALGEMRLPKPPPEPRQLERGGGGGGGRGGSVETPISFGRSWGGERIPYTNPNTPNGGPPPRDMVAHAEISRTAPQLAQLAAQLAGQIGTDTGTTILRGGQAPEQAGGPVGNTVTVLRGGQAPQTVEPSDMNPPGATTVLRGGQPPQTVSSYPTRRGSPITEVLPGSTAPGAVSPFNAQNPDWAAPEQTGKSAASPVSEATQPLQPNGKPFEVTPSPGMAPQPPQPYSPLPPLSSSAPSQASVGSAPGTSLWQSIVGLFTPAPSSTSEEGQTVPIENQNPME